MTIDLPVDMVISAISQESDVDFLAGTGVDVKRGKIAVTKRTSKTSADGVFAGGDAVTGPATVIEAIGAGIKAAQEIDVFLGGDGEIPSDIEDIAIPPAPEDVDNIVEAARVKMPTLDKESRTATAEVETGLDRQAAVFEANRCLRCDAKDEQE